MYKGHSERTDVDIMALVQVTSSSPQALHHDLYAYNYVEW